MLPQWIELVTCRQSFLICWPLHMRNIKTLTWYMCSGGSWNILVNPTSSITGNSFAYGDQYSRSSICCHDIVFTISALGSSFLSRGELVHWWNVYVFWNFHLIQGTVMKAMVCIVFFIICSILCCSSKMQQGKEQHKLAWSMRSY